MYQTKFLFFLPIHRHQAHYLEKLLQVENLNKEKWADFIQDHCDKLLKEVELEPSIDKNQINMDITDLIKIKCISQVCYEWQSSFYF